MRHARVLTAIQIVLTTAAISACGHQSHPTTALPVSSEGETYCWWTAMGTTLPPDEAAFSFQMAFRTIGLRNDGSITRGDTAWARAGPTAIDTPSTGRRWAARFVGYRQGDSTRFRYFVAVSPPSVGNANASATAATRSPIDLCAAIAKAAQIPATKPDRGPNSDDSLGVWWSSFPIVEPSQIGTAAQRAAARGALGIQYVIEATPDGGPTTGLLTPIGGTVEFASGRGRLDVVERVARPVVQVQGIRFTTLLANQGDYYLFDSTGFVLVRPRERTFSISSYVVASYNYYDSREGWPLFFGFGPIRPDTSDAVDSAVELLPIPIYWHMESYRDHKQGSPDHILAAGRMTVAEAPVAELSILRWFGPTQALVSVPGGIDALRDDSVGFTSVAVLGATPVGPNSFNVITQHAIVSLKVIDVDLSRLALPPDYTEIRDGQSSTSVSVPVDRVARWRKPPTASP